MSGAARTARAALVAAFAFALPRSAAPGQESAPAPSAVVEPPAERAAGPRVIQDARLREGTALLPHEWPALGGLQRELRPLRAAIDGDSVAALVGAAPGVAGALDVLAADTLPPALASRSEEVRGRVVALRAALARAALLADAALAAPPLAAAAGFPGDSLPGGQEAPGQGIARLPPVPAGQEVTPPPAPGPGAAPVPADTAAGDTAQGRGLEARAAYLDAWRDIVLHAEALVHLARDQETSAE